MGNHIVAIIFKYSSVDTKTLFLSNALYFYQIRLSLIEESEIINEGMRRQCTLFLFKLNFKPYNLI